MLQIAKSSYAWFNIRNMCKGGDEVKQDQPLIILEAMKMENVLASPVDGKIKEIKISPKQTVEKNSLLITFEK